MDEILEQFTTAIRLVWRRRWLAVFTAWGVSVAGWSLVATLPDTYESKSLVYVDTANILRPLLKGLAVENDLKAEVNLMQNTLLSRPNLMNVLQMTDLHLTAKTSVEMERLINDVRRRTNVVSRGDNLFFISFRDPDPVLARDVVQSLLTIFVESNVGQSRRDMENARRFIEQQIGEYENQLEVAELRLAEFKQENMSLLAGQAGYQAQLEGAHVSLVELKQRLRDAELRRDTLERELESIPPYFEEVLFQSDGPPSDSFIKAIELEQELSLLLSRYTEEHPDVIVVRRRLDRVRAQIEEENSAIPGAGFEGDDSTVGSGQSAQITPNPVYDQLKVSLINQQAEIVTLQERIIAADSKVENLRGLAESVPVVEARLTKLNRDYGVLKAKYEQLLNRRESERISRARQADVEEIQFRVTEPPEVPALPTGPKRVIFLTLSFLVGLGSGGGLAWLLGFARNTFSNISEVKGAFGVSVLGGVSRIRNRGTGLRGRAVGNACLATMVLALVASYGGVMFFEITTGFGNIHDKDAFELMQKALQL